MMKHQEKQTDNKVVNDQSTIENDSGDSKHPKSKAKPKEYGGRKSGLDPTRYGDWEKNGRCIDF